MTEDRDRQVAILTNSSPLFQKEWDNWNYIHLSIKDVMLNHDSNIKQNISQCVS